jgi:hypothetical protein
MYNFSREVDRQIFFVSMNGKALCLICIESTAVLKEYTLLGVTIRSTKKSTKTVMVLLEEKKHGGFKKWA